MRETSRAANRRGAMIQIANLLFGVNSDKTLSKSTTIFKKNTLAFDKRNKRKITVGENIFYWTVRNRLSKDILRLTVITDDKTCSRLVCEFNYKDFWFYFKEIVEGKVSPAELYDDELLKATGGSISPQLVRQVINEALKKGWKPFTKGRDFVITETEAKIDEGFRTKLTNPKSEI